ncbi:glycoside hydrolase family 3 N-terminal domain-containing protein [Halorussus aquaticus]|uniref:beta-glucosidase n=1 Tax=Halorussus aquaticus TaxID=2953748 RepID=A0ABD5Q244_9EURY
MKATGAAAGGAAMGTSAERVAARTGVNVEKRLRELTLEQKVAQMTQVAIGSFEPEPDGSNVPDNFGVDTVGELFTELGVGSVLSGGAAPPSHDGETVVKGINALQEYNLENASHDIPFLWGVDATHGNGLLEGATALPQRMNMGAARDADLVREAERHTAESTAAMGAHWTFAPTTDLQRDPRWGRFYEGISEDPTIEGEVSRARVEALESADRLTSTVKHFAGYSVPNNGNDRAPADTSLRDLRTNLLPPYKEALDADPGTVMVNSGAVNGKPAHASSWLLMRVLREAYGFEGVIISDWDDIYRMLSNHDYAPDFRQATKEAINAGIDMYMIGDGGTAPGPVEYIDTVVSLVRDGEIKRKRIDDAVRRILALKADLGLFDRPTVDESRLSDALGGAQETSEKLAKESLVLLTNENDALPLSGSENVLLTGPGVDENGNNTRPLMQHGGWTLGWQGPSAGGPFPRQSLVADELRDRFANVTHVPTSFDNQRWWSGEQTDANGNFEFTDEQERKVRSAAPNSDAVVVVLGEGPHNEGFGDRDDLELDAAQRELLSVVNEETGDDTPVVGVMLAGSPRGSPETHDMLDALLFAGQPGSDGGVAIADALVGEYNPSGKLAFSWPQNVGTVPVQYDRAPPTSTGGADNTALYEFGHGLSYTDFEYGNVSVSPGSVSDPSKQSSVTARVDVTNTGDAAGDHVVEVYNTQSYGSVLQPRRRLMGYERVSLDPGQTERVEVELDLSTLEVVPDDVLALRPKVVEAGDYELTVGQDGPTATLSVQRTGGVTDSNITHGRSGRGRGRGNGKNSLGDVFSRFRTGPDSE